MTCAPAAVPGAAAATNGLDPSFAQGGIYKLDLTEPSVDVAHAGVYGRAGPVVAGSAVGRFALGALQSNPYAFNNGRNQRIVDFGRPSAAHAVVEVNGVLAAAGRAGDDFALAFLEPDGDPARGFPDQGRVRTSFGAPAVANALASVAEGRHIAAGTVQTGAGSSLAMALYDAGGRLDPSFGSAGKAVVDITPGVDSANAVAFSSTDLSDQILVAGQAGGGLLLARFRGDGTPDPVFGTGGRVVLDLTPGDDVARAVGFFGRGILVAGSAGSQAFLAAFTLQGALDPAFGNGGVLLTTFGGTAARVSSVSWDAHRNKVLAGGTVTGPGGDDAVIARFEMDGVADPSFGAAGRVVRDMGGRSDEGNALIRYSPVDPLRLVGGDGADMVAISVDSTDGSAVPDAGDGRRVVDFGAETVEWAAGVATLPDGRIVVGGSGAPGIILVRLLPDGAPDPTFGRGGLSVTPVAAHVQDVVVVDGRILVLARRPNRLLGTGVFGFSADGILDRSYGLEGFAHTELSVPGADLAAMPDGGVVLGAGTQVLKLSASGQVVATYVGGHWPLSVIALTVQPDGKVVVLSERTLRRLNADGTADETFPGNHWLPDTPRLTMDAGAILSLADGRLAVGGRSTTLSGGPPPDPELMLAGFAADGSLDTRFGSGGSTSTPAGGVAGVVALTQHGEGKILSVFVRHHQADAFGLARYLPDGTLDPSFGTAGVTTIAGVRPLAATPGPGGKLLVAGSAGGDLAVARALPPDTSAPASYHAVSPVRLLDTRAGVGAPAARLGPASTLRLQVTGRGGVPLSGVSAVVLNVTVTEPTHPSFLTAWPAGSARPLASNLNYTTGQTVPNLVTVKVGEGGRVDLYNSTGSTHVVADLAGWYGGPDGDRYSTLSPARLLDTRTGLGAPFAPVGPGSTVTLQVTGRGGVPPSGVSAVVLNVTATEPSAASFLTAWPAGSPRPLASNLNYTAGQTVPNLVTVKVGTAGRVDLYNSAGSVHLVADVAGWYGAEGSSTGALFSTVAPARVLDTRVGQGAAAARLGPGSTLRLQVTGRGGVPASGVSAVVLNVTATEPTSPSHLTVWPAGSPHPVASNLNYATGRTVPNLVVVAVGQDGNVNLYNNAGFVHLVADVAGWYGSG